MPFDIAAFTALTTGLKTLLEGIEIVKKTLPAKDSAKLVELQNDTNKLLLEGYDLRQEVVVLLDEKRQLVADIQKVKAWEIEKERYQLVNTWQGAYFYALKKGCGGQEPPHLLCTKCYEDGKKSIPNPTAVDGFVQRYSFLCPECGSDIAHMNRGIPKVKFAEEYLTETPS